MKEKEPLKLDSQTRKAAGGVERLSTAVRRMGTAIRQTLDYGLAQMDQLNLLSAATQQAAQSQQALARATQAAGKAAKGSLAVFDKLNVLEQRVGAGGGGGGGSKPKPEPPEAEKPPEPILPLPDWPGIADGLGILEAAVAALDAVLRLIQPGASWLWENFLKPLGEWGGGMVVSALEGIALMLNGISDWIEENRETLDGFFGWIGQLFTGLAVVVQTGLEGIKILWDQLWVTLSESLVAFLDLILGLITLNWEQVGQSLLTIFDSFKTLLLTAFNGMWTSIQAGFQQSWLVVQKMWQPVAQWFAEQVLTPLQTNFGTLWEQLALTADLAYQLVKGVWEPLSSWFLETIINPIANGFDWLCQTIVGNFRAGLDAAVEMGKVFINGFLNSVEAGANLFIEVINKIIEALNTIQVEIPDWVPKYGGQSFGVNLPMVSKVSIPRLAQGAVIPPNAEFAAILGDQRSGRNLEAPEGLIRQIVREESGGQEITIRFEGSMAQLVRMLGPELEREQNRRGARLIAGGVGL